MKNENAEEIIKLSNAWAKAIVDNDAEAIGKFIADDWVIVSKTGISEKHRFLELVASGELTHESMEAIAGTTRVRVCGDMAVLTARVTNTAHFGGKEFLADEWTTDVFAKINGEWKCVLTHLTDAD